MVEILRKTDPDLFERPVAADGGEHVGMETAVRVDEVTFDLLRRQDLRSVGILQCRGNLHGRAGTPCRRKIGVRVEAGTGAVTPPLIPGKTLVGVEPGTRRQSASGQASLAAAVGRKTMVVLRP